MGRIRLAHVRASALLLSFVGPAAAVGPHNCGADGRDPADRPTDLARARERVREICAQRVADPKPLISGECCPQAVTAALAVHNWGPEAKAEAQSILLILYCTQFHIFCISKSH